MSASEIAKRHLEAAIAEGKARSASADTIARAMLSQAIATFLVSRSPDDVKQELLAAAENVDPETDYAFMRP
jgi:hypothetical protein